MKRTLMQGWALLALATLVLPPLLPAETRAEGPDAPRPTAASDVKIQIQGSSTLHGWRVSAGAVSVTAGIRPGGTGLLDALSQGGLAGLDLVLGVDTLQSTEGSGMDKNLRHDLDSDKFPTIGFHLTGYRMRGLTVTAQGDLDIHGQTQAVTLTGMVTPQVGGLLVSGAYPLKMSDYGVKPPVMFFGTVRVADQVKIVYSFTLPD